MRVLGLAIATLTLGATTAPGEPIVTEVIRRQIPNAPGFEAHAIRVTYLPRQESAPHSHRGFVIAYMLRGTIESRVGEGPLRTFGVGDSWTEDPGEKHLICRNPSASEPAEFLVVFVERRADPVVGGTR